MSRTEERQGKFHGAEGTWMRTWGCLGFGEAEKWFGGRQVQGSVQPPCGGSIHTGEERNPAVLMVDCLALFCPGWLP